MAAAALEVNSTKVWVYTKDPSGILVPVYGSPFGSMRKCCKVLPVSPSTLLTSTSWCTKINTGLPFKGYLYFDYSQN